MKHSCSKCRGNHLEIVCEKYEKQRASLEKFLQRMSNRAKKNSNDTDNAQESNYLMQAATSPAGNALTNVLTDEMYYTEDFSS